MDRITANLRGCARDLQAFANAATTLGLGYLADKLYCIGAEIEACVERIEKDGSIG